MIYLEHQSYVGGVERNTTGRLQGAVEGFETGVIAYDGNNISELAADWHNKFSITG